MRAVGEAENPQHGHVRGRGIFISCDGTIEPAFSNLRLAFRQSVDVDRIAFNNVENFSDQRIRLGEMIWSNKIEIVRGRVILGNFSKLTALQKSNG